MRVEIAAEDDRMKVFAGRIFRGETIDFSEKILNLRQFDVATFRREEQMRRRDAEEIVRIPIGGHRLEKRHQTAIVPAETKRKCRNERKEKTDRSKI